MRILSAVLLGTALLAGCRASPRPGALGPPPDPAVLAALQRGGLVIYFRHATSDPRRDYAVPATFEDCSTQPNLTEAGRVQAHAIGVAFAQLRIPVGDVWSSPWCRCTHTAYLAFGRAIVDPDLQDLRNADQAARERCQAALVELLSTAPAQGFNTVIVSHADNFAAIGAVELAEGEGAIVVPERPGHFRVLARIRAEQWTTLAAPATQRGR